MDRNTTVMLLEKTAKEKQAWNKARADWWDKYESVMAVLIHAAATNYMSATDIARHAGMKPTQVRALFHKHGLHISVGKRALADQAAKALRENADLMGVRPEEIDLMSPLAYLPMGQSLKQALLDETTRGTAPEVSGNDYEEAKARIETALHMGMDVEEISVSQSNIPEIAAWLAGEGIK